MLKTLIKKQMMEIFRGYFYATKTGKSRTGKRRNAGSKERSAGRT